jgi:hypothetical protein
MSLTPRAYGDSAILSTKLSFELALATFCNLGRAKVRKRYESTIDESGRFGIAMDAGLGDFARIRSFMPSDPLLAPQVLTYLSRYTHRIAIANSRLLAMADGRVTFRWRDYAHGHQTRTMPLEADEFLRRFLLHVLPASFVRIRYFGSSPIASVPDC